MQLVMCGVLVYYYTQCLLEVRRLHMVLMTLHKISWQGLGKANSPWKGATGVTYQIWQRWVLDGHREVNFISCTCRMDVKYVHCFSLWKKKCTSKFYPTLRMDLTSLHILCRAGLKCTMMSCSFMKKYKGYQRCCWNADMCVVKTHYEAMSILKLDNIYILFALLWRY